MPTGIQFLAPSGAVIIEYTERYSRIVETINPIALGVPGSKTYAELDPDDLDFIYFQGGGRVVTIQKQGNQISWDYSDGFAWPEFTGTARLVVMVR